MEAPSQMFEEWSRRPETLVMFAQVCPTCKPIDPKLMERMNASRAFGKGIQYARQRLYAARDMSLHTPKVVDTKLGTRYRKLILESGGQRAPSELVEDFLERNPSPEAFFREISGK